MGRDGSRKEDRWYYIFLPYNMAGGSINPLVPLFVTEGLGGNVAQAGIISAVSSLGGVPGNILWGNLSDSLKRRRPFIFVGFIGMAFALFLMAISTTISIYYFANFVYGFLISAIAPIATVLVIESFG
ncbi:MAG: MFS transporter, partial [Methanomassiliicoccales archaeon]